MATEWPRLSYTRLDQESFTPCRTRYAQDGLLMYCNRSTTGPGAEEEPAVFEVEIPVNQSCKRDYEKSTKQSRCQLFCPRNTPLKKAIYLSSVSIGAFSIHLLVSSFQIIWAYYRCSESGHVDRNESNSNAYIVGGFGHKQCRIQHNNVNPTEHGRH